MKYTIYIIVFLFAILSSEQLCANNNIQMNQEIGDPYQHGGRDIYAMPTATLDGTVITLSYPLATESQVILIGQSSQATVYSETFAASRSVIIDLAEEGLGEGIYTLHVYAFGKWWWGEFEIQTEDY